MECSNSHALYSRFARGLSLSPDRPAFHSGGESLSYEQAHRTALSWAGALLDPHGNPPKAVGVLASTGTTANVGVLAALYAGAAVVPLRPDHPSPRVMSMADSAGIDAVIADHRATDIAKRLLEEAPDLRIVDPAAVDAAGRPPLAEPRPVSPDDVAYILFTSGSTGRPKGVRITHANTHHYFGFVDGRFDFSGGDVFAQTFDLTFDCAMFTLFCAWGAGATVVEVPPSAYRDVPGFVARQGITVWFSTPSAIALVRKVGRLTPGAMPGLRWSLFAGEALKERDAADWLRAAPASTLENLYGPTELTVTIAAHRWDPRTSPGLCVNGLSPIGDVNGGHEAVLVDAAGAPAHDEGELWIRGPQLTSGYLDPRDEDGRYVQRDGATWYNTGDRVRRAANGEMVYLGRQDSQVQVQGWRVELAEIDHAARSCPAVTEAVTVSTESADRVHLVVFYTGRPIPPPDFAAHLGDSLPSGIVPKRYVHIEEFPMNSNKKIDRAELSKRAAALANGQV
ncbi:amino acid adenylation domain-containing protein [Murinocardiopsis flavida]|uniref:Amino acid adenylation domain-containing protein n=1 Tax=Murinocardiopsis flavida TaxID=645275 RepID=A0A2P8C861_9ACTN|nr:AMP-binding protein [Murinocardiopsis flavida]PSK81159.1 amino acid adenylation domain-containing protein [Murinocardiopsis flavida]